MRFFSLVRGQTWWAIVAATVAAAIIGAALSIVLPATYRAEATLLVTGPGASRELQLTYVDLLTSDGFLESLAQSVDATPAELSSGLQAIPAPGTTLIGVVVEEDSYVHGVGRGIALDRLLLHKARNGGGALPGGFVEPAVETNVAIRDARRLCLLSWRVRRRRRLPCGGW